MTAASWSRRGVNEPGRLEAMDVLRGVAVLGILLMNIQAFSMIEAAYLNPTAYGDLAGANYWVWIVSHVTADSKFLAIFGLLFGASVLIMAEKGRTQKSGMSSTQVHYRRMAWLVAFGVLHGYSLSSGDILYTLGLCGMVVFVLRGLRPMQLLAVGAPASANAHEQGAKCSTKKSRTHRQIGGHAPSDYLPAIETAADIEPWRMDQILASHCIAPEHVRKSDFWGFYATRAEMLLQRIETATGKKITREAELFGEDQVPESYDDGPPLWDVEEAIADLAS